MVLNIRGLSCRNAADIGCIGITAGQDQGVGVCQFQGCYGFVDHIFCCIIFQFQLQDNVFSGFYGLDFLVIHIEAIALYHEGRSRFLYPAVFDIDISIEGTLTVNTIFFISSSEGNDFISGGGVRRDRHGPVNGLAGAIFHGAQLSAVIDIGGHKGEGLQISGDNRCYGHVGKGLSFIDDGNTHNHGFTRFSGG